MPTKRRAALLAPLTAPAPGRLLDIAGSAAYLGQISKRTVRALIANGVLTPVRIPSTRDPSEPGRRVLLDTLDLDKLIEVWKAASTGAPNQGLSDAALKGWECTPVRKRRGVA